MDLAQKIKTLPELAEIVGSRPRARRVVMCAGVFDVVHPGHIRHLIYAKQHADILVASVTADRHIDKGQYRPHVPEGLRAMNLAAMEMVDYVVVDQNATAIGNIIALQPDFFAKGYEYSDLSSPKTAEEAEVLAAFGGKILFTPGDVIYSSSKLVEMGPPSLKYEKLLMVMERGGVTFGELRRAITTFPKFHVHVVGDTIVDSVTRTAMIGGQTKTPTISVLFEKCEDFVGGAGIVAMHLRAAGARVTFSTVLGADALGRFAATELQAAGIQCRSIIDSTRPTTNKNAIDAGGYKLLKIDTLDNRSIGDDILTRLCEDLRSIESDAAVFSDFRHGLFNRRTIPALTAAIAAPYRVADSQVATRWGNVTEFQSFDLITPNEREARFALGDQDSGIRALADSLAAAAKCHTLLLKLGERGMLAVEGGDFFALDSFCTHVVDAVGAGDAMLAYATLSMLATKNMAVAAIVGAVAAALECESDGNLPVTPARVLDRLCDIEREANYGPRD